jgi:hypothetical protein
LPACCYQPAFVGGIIYADLKGELSTHLAPQALFTQSSAVLGEVTLHPLSQACMFVYSSRGKWVFPPLLWSCSPTATFTSFTAPDYWVVLLLLPAAVFVYSSCGKWVFPPLLWSFPLSATLTSFPTPGCWMCARLPPEALWPAWLVYLQSWEGFPSPSLQHSVCPTLFPVCLFCSYCLLLSFSFFPGWRSVCPGGYADLAQACLWEYCSTAKLTLSASSQAIWAQVTGGLGALLVSPLT